MKVNNRQFLRNYKVLKNKLLKGKIEAIVIPQPSGQLLKLILIKSNEHSFEHFLKKVKRHPFKDLKRPVEDII